MSWLPGIAHLHMAISNLMRGNIYRAELKDCTRGVSTLRPHSQLKIDLFIDFLDGNGLMDMAVKGCRFT